MDAQGKAESDDCTLAEIGECFGAIYKSFAEHAVLDHRVLLLEKLERRWKWFYEPELMVIAMYLHPGIKLSKFQVKFFSFINCPKEICKILTIYFLFRKTNRLILLIQGGSGETS